MNHDNPASRPMSPLGATLFRLLADAMRPDPALDSLARVDAALSGITTGRTSLVPAEPTLPDRAERIRSLSDGHSTRTDRGVAWKSPVPTALPYAYSPHVGDTSWHATAAEAVTALERHWQAHM